MTTKPYPTLYKPDSKGKVRLWSISVEENVVRVEHGIKDGKLQIKEEKVSGKNKGRANETTAVEQALRVAEAKWLHQRDRKGYGESIEEAVVAKLPMLAYDYHKHGHRIKFPCMVQPKLDGIRAVVEKLAEGDIRITSRTGKVFSADLSHITTKLDEMLQPGAMLDGELYIHGEELEDISSATKKDGPLTKELKFFVFDIIYPGMPNSQRAFMLENAFIPSDPVYLTKTYTIKDFADIERFHEKCCELGFEGVMIRNLDGQYRFNHRSADLQKYKVMLDAEFPIIDCTEDKDGNALFVLADIGGDFRCVLVGDKEENRKYLSDESLWKGKQMTVQFQKRYHKTGIPQFPVGKAVRDYE